METNSDGALRYVSALKGDMDGCQLEVLKMVDQQELIVRIVDDSNGGLIESAKYKLGIRQNSDGKIIGTIMRHLSTEQPGLETSINMDTFELSETNIGFQKEINHLAAWWLLETGAEAVCFGGDSEPRTAADLVGTYESRLDESPMEKFYSGESVVLRNGLTLDAVFDSTPAQNWLIELAIHNGTDFIGVIAGSVDFFNEDILRFNIAEWTNLSEENPSVKTDVLALALRLIENRIGKVEVVYNGKFVEIPEDFIDYKTRPLLGF